MSIDFYLFNQVNQFAGKNVCLDSAAIFFAEYLQYTVVFFLFLFLIKNFRKYFKVVFSALLAAVFSRFFIAEIIRYLFPRSRPFIDNPVNLLINHSPELSFPSGHATFFFALATVVFLYDKKINPRPKFWWGAGTFFLISAFLISIARIFAGIHWPSDIAGGAVVGILSGIFIHFLSRKIFETGKK